MREKHDHRMMHTAPSLAHPNQLWRTIRDYLDSVVGQTGYSDWCFGLSVAGKRYYYAKGEKRAESSRVLSDMAFEMSCIVNPLFAAVATALSDKNEMDLEAPLVKYIPELADDPKAHEIRVHHLLSHTGGHKGFLAFWGFENKGHLFESVRKAPQIFFPGSVFSYEQSGPALLSLVLRRVYGHPLSDMLHNEIFEPLGLSPRWAAGGGQDEKPRRFAIFRNAKRDRNNGSTHGLPEHAIPSLIRLRIDDVLTVAEALMGKRAGHNAPAGTLSESVVERLRSRIIAIPRTTRTLASELLPIAYGMGSAIFQGGFFGYDGRAGRQVLGFRYNPEHRIAIALGMNSGAPALRRVMLKSVADRIGLPRNGQRNTTPSQFQLDEIVGHYVGNHSLDVRVLAENDGVTLDVSSSKKTIFQSHGKLSRGGGLEFHTQDPGGEPTFFREPGTDSTCMMLGMCAFKRVA